MDREELKKITDFNIEEYIPNFYKFGYFTNQNNIKLNAKVLDEFYEDIVNKSLRQRITISSISINLKEDIFIYKLFNDLLCNEEHPIIRFYFLYQIIELLIKKVFADQFNKKIASISPKNEDLFDLNKRLQEMTDEKWRVNLLLTKYSNVRSPELEELLLNFLGITDKNQSYTLAYLLYKTRTFLVHNLRDIKLEQKNLMNDINFYFERVVIYLLINYK